MVLLAIGALWWWRRGALGPEVGRSESAAPTGAVAVVPMKGPAAPTNHLVPAELSNSPPARVPLTVTNHAGSVPTNVPVTLTPGTNGNIPSVPATGAVASASPPEDATVFPRAARDVFEAQLALARRGYSSGSLDGVLGNQTRAALRVFQSLNGLPVTGDLDPLTRSRLILETPPLTNYTVSPYDLARLRPLGTNWLSKSLQDRMDYETILELVSEKARAHPTFVRSLNPGIAWDHVTAGTTVRVPSVAPPPRAKAAFVRIHLSAKTLEVFDAQTNLLAHFPCSIARRVEKRPVGTLRVAVVATRPTYRFDPANFPESAEARELNRILILPAGPNNPVGTAWIGLNKPGYGIHGTPRPEEVGRTESHGCFRLANWDADHLAQLVTIGTPVIVEL